MGSTAQDDRADPGPDTGEWKAWASRTRDEIVDSGRWRSVRDLDACGPRGILCGSGRQVVNFASNDYLGLTHHPSVVDAASTALERWGAGSGSSRLVVGSRPVHSDLEAEIARWKCTQSAVVFPTGYAANLGVLTVLGGPDVTVFSDTLNHASIVDGCRLSGSEVRVFEHRDLDHLDHLLARASTRRRLVVSDSVFSMDGDAVDACGLAETCARHGALLVVDEAHAVFGPDIPEDAVRNGAVIRVGTLSKMLGALGGFVACPSPIADILVNRARPFIFTTAPTPADSAAGLKALEILRSTEGENLLAELRRRVDIVRQAHPSPIIPVLLGSESDALAASSTLEERGYLVPAIRPPSVPPGTSRLRITLTVDHSDDDIRGLLCALSDIGCREDGQLLRAGSRV